MPLNFRMPMAIAGALVCWFAVLMQAWLLFSTSPLPAGEILLRFLSYFTILTNILCAVAFTVIWRSPTGTGFFTRPAVLTAITVYILIVGLVYNLVLRFLWQPTGLQKIVDELLHVVDPLYFLLFWICCVPKASIHWQQIPRWMLYPLVYLAWVLLRGALADWYPYPFLDVVQFGYTKVLANALLVCAAFLLVSAIMVWWARRASRQASS